MNFLTWLRRLFSSWRRPPSPPPTTPVSSSVAAAINAARARIGRPPYAFDPGLTAVASGWAHTLASRGYLTHGDFPGRINSLHPSAAGENIEEGPTTAEGIVALWMSDPAHRANILSSLYTRVGVGLASDAGGTVWAVADFDTP